MKKQAGFTLIELIIVIVVLGILAVFAIPKYVNFAKEGRIAVVNGMKGSVLSAVAMVHGIAQAKSACDDASVEINGAGSGVDIVDCYPAATDDGIKAALSDTAGFTGTASIDQALGNIYTFKKDDNDSCSVTYVESTREVNLDTSGC